MPCSDVTEMVQVVIDRDDRLKSYTYSKKTCGRGVGAATLLMEPFAGMSVDDLLALDAETFLARHPVENELEEFLRLKHFFAVQSALEVLTGHEPGGPEDICAAAEIAYDNGDIVIEARILVDLVTEKIASCGNCKGCGTKKTKVVFG